MDFILAYWHLMIIIVAAVIAVGWLLIRLRREPSQEYEAGTSPPLAGLFWGPSFVRWLDTRLGLATRKNRRRELLLWLVFVVILIVGIVLTPRK